jgi:hypothetical protein
MMMFDVVVWIAGWIDTDYLPSYYEAAKKYSMR